MKASYAANIALALSPASWLFSYWGAMSQLGGLPISGTSPLELEAQRHFSVLLLFIGCVGLISSLWLSGIAFLGAPRRSVLGLAAFAVPFALIFLSTFW